MSRLFFPVSTVREEDFRLLQEQRRQVSVFGKQGSATSVFQSGWARTLVTISSSSGQLEFELVSIVF